MTDIEYRGSQPWPFQSSLMLGFRTRATSYDINVGADELEDVRWFAWDQVASLEGFGFKLQRRDSIAYLTDRLPDREISLSGSRATNYKQISIHQVTQPCEIALRSAITSLAESVYVCQYALIAKGKWSIGLSICHR